MRNYRQIPAARPVLARLLAVLAALSCLAVAASAGENPAPAPRPWQRPAFPSASVVAEAFRRPPPEWSVTVTWGWDGPMSREAIGRDLDALRAAGFRAVTIEAGYDMDNAPYLSDGWFEFVRYAVEQARARDMRVWIIDEGKYPSGFAGGLFTRERPDLRMQGIAVREDVPVAAGTTLECAVGPEVLSALALRVQDGANEVLPIKDGRTSWTAPKEGEWVVRLVDHQFRTPVTRAVNDPKRAKTAANSMGDLLNPVAVDQFIAWTHEAYAQHLGDELGRTVLGFRGDEPDFAFLPYTDGILDAFREKKGYDVRPHLAAFASISRGQPQVSPTDEQRRMRADYWDVWSSMFADNYFSRLAAWCETHGVEYIVHLNNEHNMPRLVRSTGDFFRPMRHVQIPAVDSIWNQVWPGRVADFVRLPASAAHLYGRPRVLSESFAAYREFPVTVDTARWAINYQLARGINAFELMFYPSSARRDTAARLGYMAEPDFRGLAEYTTRAGYLLAQGRPGASVGLFFPIGNLWMGDNEVDKAVMTLAAQLQGMQRDFDFVDEQALDGLLRLDERGRLRNRSGGGYRAVIVPEGAFLSQTALAQLEAFAKAGSKVVTLGKGPSLVFDRAFRDAKPIAAVPEWMICEKSGQISAAVLDALPGPDLVLDPPTKDIKYIRRRLADASVWFLFNEGGDAWSGEVTLRGRGQLQIWDATSGNIVRTGVLDDNGTARTTVTLQAGEARILVIAVSAPEVASR